MRVRFAKLPNYARNFELQTAIYENSKSGVITRLFRFPSLHLRLGVCRLLRSVRADWWLFREREREREKRQSMFLMDVTSARGLKTRSGTANKCFLLSLSALLLRLLLLLLPPSSLCCFYFFILCRFSKPFAFVCSVIWKIAFNAVNLPPGGTHSPLPPRRHSLLWVRNRAPVGGVIGHEFVWNILRTSSGSGSWFL